MQVLHVVMCADSRFVVPLAVALRSINDSQSEAGTVLVTVLSIGISVEDRARLTESISRIDVSFVDVDALIPEDVPFSKARLTRATYGRLFAADAVGPGIDRLLYLDTDVLVRDDLRALADFDFNGHPIAATRDVSQPVLSVGFPAWRELGMSPSTPYYNAGVLLIDVQAWHARGIRAAALDFLYQHGDRCRYADQDGLNAALRGDFARLPARWNQDAAFRHPRHLAYAFLDQAEVEAAERAPAIIHFTGAIKPWLPGCHDPATELWRQTLAMTAWRDLVVKESRLATVRRAAARLPMARRAVDLLRAALR
jgi:lipopolysaccharide biosynthesis glycosyltransferase